MIYHILDIFFLIFHILLIFFNLILEKLGKTYLPYSYTKYLADRLTGFDINATLVDNVTLYSFLEALGFSIVLNMRDYKKGRKK